jgi:hypothetical protein
MPIVSTGLQLSLDASNASSYSGTGTAWNDLSGNGNNFALQNSPTWNSSGYFTFNGSNQYARLDSPASSLINWYSSAYTCCFWVCNFSFTSSQNGGPVGFGNSETNNIQYWTLGTNSSGTVQLYYYNGSPTYVTTSTTLTTGSWNYLCFTQSGGTITIYVNGTSVYTTTISGTPQSSNSYPMNLGGTSNFLNGRVFTAQVYNIALSAAQISQNYTAQSPPSGLTNVDVTQNALLSVQSSTSANADVRQSSILSLQATPSNADVRQSALLVLYSVNPPTNTDVTQNSILSLQSTPSNADITQSALLVLQSPYFYYNRNTSENLSTTDSSLPVKIFNTAISENLAPADTETGIPTYVGIAIENILVKEGESVIAHFVSMEIENINTGESSFVLAWIPINDTEYANWVLIDNRQ